jgi:predicted glycosyltransferase
MLQLYLFDIINSTITQMFFCVILSSLQRKGTQLGVTFVIGEYDYR